MEEKEKQKLVLAYNRLKKSMDKQRDSETLNKFKILSEALIIGKKIYGKFFTKTRLSIDFEIPYTTVSRVLSLSKANKSVWKLIEDKKISVFKVAMILQSKCITYQDEIIDMVIKNNLSTYDIKKIRVNDYKDIDKERIRVAVEKGFASQDAAYRSFGNTITRLSELCLLESKYLPKKKINKLRKDLVIVRNKIDKYVEELEVKK